MRKSEYEDKESVFSSLWKSISFWSKDNSAGSVFLEHLSSPKDFKINALKMTLKDGLHFFDFATKQKVLMVYVMKPTIADSRMNKRIESLILSKYSSLINQKFAFIGVLDTSPEIIELHQFNIRSFEHPCFLFFCYDICDQLKLMKRIDLDFNLVQNADDLLPILLNDVSSIHQMIKEEDEQMVLNLEAKYEESLRPQVQFPYQGPSPYNPSQNMVGHYPVDFEDNYYDYDEYQAFAQAQQHTVQRPPAPANPQLDYERQMKLEQEKAYQQIIEKQKEEMRKKAEEEQIKLVESQRQVQQQQKREALKAKFAAPAPSGVETISIGFRLPSGKRETREFEKSDRLADLRDYISILENKGFIEENSDYELFTGFPSRKLEENLTLREIFDNSDSELVHVKEVQH